MQLVSIMAYPLRHLNIYPLGNLYPCCILNGRIDFRIGNLGELLDGEWDSVLGELKDRTVKKYKRYGEKKLPCLGPRSMHSIASKRYCPLFAQPI